MADKKISELNSVSLPLSGTEVIPIVQGGETKKITADDLKSDRLSNDIADYTTATLPLSDADKLLVNQGGTFKEVAKSELGGGGKYTIDFSFGNAWLGTSNTSWRTILYGLNSQSLYVNPNNTGTNINYDSATNTLPVSGEIRFCKWTLPFDCTLDDILSEMGGALNINLQFRVIYFESPSAFDRLNFQLLGIINYVASTTGGKLFPTITSKNTTTNLSKGGHVLIIWFNNSGTTPTFNSALIQATFTQN